MDKLSILDKIKDIYDNGENVIQYLKNIEGNSENTIEDIMISYDFQAGSYYNGYKNNKQRYDSYHDKIAEILGIYINDIKNCVLMEAGIGEATTLGPVMKRIGINNVDKIYGFDISWSRVKYAKKFLGELLENDAVNLFVGDMFNIPIKDNSIDILYTAHAIEPNGGKEKEILQELYRVTSKYLVLFEPAYELADEESKKRMESHGYITNLYNTALELGYNVKSYELLGVSMNQKNPTGVMVIEKSEVNGETKEDTVFCDPISKKILKFVDNVAYCESSMLMYPIILDIPCLIKSNAIIGTKFNDFV